MHKAYSELKRDPYSFLVFGVALGGTLGVIFDDVSWGLIIGFCVGVIFTKKEMQKIEREKKEGIEHE